MGQQRRTRHVDAPAAEVFRAFTDPGLLADWMEADGVIDQRGPLDTGGSTYTLVISGPWRFRMRVTRSMPPRAYGLEGRGPLGTSYRMTADLTAHGSTTELVVETEWTLPFGPVGRWMDRRWVEPGTRGEDDRELDRLVAIVTGRDATSPRAGTRDGRRRRELEAEVEAAQRAFLEREVAGWTSRRIRWSGGETQVIEAGAGEPLLIVHGGMGNAADWAPLIGRLARDRRVVAVERPGHGLASFFDYRGVDLWAHAAGFLTEVLDALGLRRVDIAGNSMGGLFGIALAEAHPERVRTLTLVGAPAGTQHGLPAKVGLLAWPILGRLVIAMVRRSTSASTRSFWDRLIVAHAERLSDESLRFTALAARRNADSWRSIVCANASVRGIARRNLIAGRLARLAVPVAWVVGERDAFTSPGDNRRLAALSPVPGPFVVIPDAGHLPWFDEPDLVAEAILAAVTTGATASAPVEVVAPQPDAVPA
ncbi:MAG: alpha/beta fold hydrolase [Chloroflexi bacterium]|nr:alpha/beta fold hydrolase [Chloroflexota bacterium]